MLYSKLRSRLRSCATVILCSTLMAPGAAFAQQTLGAIVGNVSDTQGAALPGVKVTAVEEGTHLTRTTESTSAGLYAFPNLPIGTYTVSFEHEGFTQERYPGIAVQADRTVSLPTNLKPGAVSDAVTV
jgi:hypothetical protein